MSKPKTHKGIAKRMKKTATGKILRRHAGNSHLMGTKNAKRRRKIRGMEPLSPGFQKVYTLLLPRR